jgi:Spy/CpxP family protein refolding chaperone
MNKKSLVFALALALGIPMAATAFAQQADGEGCPHARGEGEGRGPGHHGRRGHHGPERMVERLSERLSLTDAQRAQVTTIVRESHEQRARVEGILEQAATRISAILNPEQRTQFEALKAEIRALRERRHERREQRRNEREGI